MSVKVRKSLNSTVDLVRALNAAILDTGKKATLCSGRMTFALGRAEAALTAVAGSPAAVSASTLEPLEVVS